MGEMVNIGCIDSFGIKVSKHSNMDMHHVEMFVLGKNISSDDMDVYKPQFVYAIELDIERVTSIVNNLKLIKAIDDYPYEELLIKLLAVDNTDAEVKDENIFNIADNCRVLSYGPTTDHLCVYLIPYNSKVYLECFIFNMSNMCHAGYRCLAIEIEPKEMISVLKELRDYLINSR